MPSPIAAKLPCILTKHASAGWIPGQARDDGEGGANAEPQPAKGSSNRFNRATLSPLAWGEVGPQVRVRG